MTDIENNVLTLTRDFQRLHGDVRDFSDTLHGRNGEGGLVKDIRDLKTQNEILLGKQDTLSGAIKDVRELVKGALYIMGGGVAFSILLSLIAIGVSIMAYLK